MSRNRNQQQTDSSTTSTTTAEPAATGSELTKETTVVATPAATPGTLDNPAKVKTEAELEAERVLEEQQYAEEFARAEAALEEKNKSAIAAGRAPEPRAAKPSGKSLRPSEERVDDLAGEYLVRIHPYAKEQGYVLRTYVLTGRTFKVELGWYQVPVEIAKKLAKVKSSGDPRAPWAFDVAASKQEAQDMVDREKMSGIGNPLAPIQVRMGNTDARSRGLRADAPDQGRTTGRTNRIGVNSDEHTATPDASGIAASRVLQEGSEPYDFNR